MYIKIQLHCINSRLLNSKMGIYAGISSCASKILVFPVWYVLFCSTVTKFLCQTKVDNVELSLYKQQKKKNTINATLIQQIFEQVVVFFSLSLPNFLLLFFTLDWLCTVHALEKKCGSSALRIYNVSQKGHYKIEGGIYLPCFKWPKSSTPLFHPLATSQGSNFLSLGFFFGQKSNSSWLSKHEHIVLNTTTIFQHKT